MISAPRRRSHAVGLWLALITICAHALAPSASPLTRSWGSAFNAFTSDVSLGPKHANALEQRGSERSDPAGAGGSEAGTLQALARLTLSTPLPAARAVFPTPPAVAPGRLFGRSFQPRAPPFA